MKARTVPDREIAPTGGGAGVRVAPHWRRPSVTITPVERAGRIVLGIGVVVAGAVLLTTAPSALAIVLEVLLVAAGLDLIVTGSLGHCPLYARLGHVPEALRRPT